MERGEGGRGEQLNSLRFGKKEERLYSFKIERRFG